MMNSVKIIINATALDQRGAYSLLKAFILEMNDSTDYLNNNNIHLHFLVSRSELCEFENEFVKIVYNPVSKKSVFHKWVYEKFTLPAFVKKEGFDAYLSLQNYVLKNINIKRFALIHQPIPFSDLRFNEMEFINWLKYKVIYTRILKKQAKFIDGVIVQTKWMKDAVILDFHYDCPVQIIRPEVENIRNNNSPLDEKVLSLLQSDSIKIFYPTSSDKYKNNDRIINAVLELNKNAKNKVALYITLEGNSNEFVKYTGKIPFESIYTFYKSIDALVFPSLTETMGFPLLEAQQCRLPIIAADLPYAREICGDNAFYFDPRNRSSISETIQRFTDDFVKRSGKEMPSHTHKGTDRYLDYIKFIVNHL